MPYVYMCIHKTTKQFYIGYREANTIPSNIDLPKYKTSSKFVRPIFQEFYWYIIAEFFNGNDAYDFEQRLIEQNFNNDLILNCQYVKSGNGKFKSNKKDEKCKKRLSAIIKKSWHEHHDISGEKNPTAKKIQITTPDGIEILCNGNLKEICKKLNISYCVMGLKLRKNRIFTKGSSVGYSIKYIT